jgi:hypothetical protein
LGDDDDEDAKEDTDEEDEWTASNGAVEITFRGEPWRKERDELVKLRRRAKNTQVRDFYRDQEKTLEGFAEVDQLIVDAKSEERGKCSRFAKLSYLLGGVRGVSEAITPATLYLRSARHGARSGVCVPQISFHVRAPVSFDSNFVFN